MKIVCDSCSAKYSIADEKVAGKVFKIRCKKCSEVIVVRGDQLDQPQDEATQVYDYGDENPDAIWHVVVNGDQQGPFTPQQLGEMLTAGTIDWEVYVWREGFDNWLAARDVPDLVEAITGQAQDDGGEAAAAAAPAAGAEADPYAAGGDDAFGASAGGDASFGGSPAADAGGGAGDGLFAASGDAGFGGDAAFGGGSAGGGADLFAQADGGGSSPFDVGGTDDAEDVVASSPSPRVSADQAMTGQRNENSVLFSLQNLQALATGGPGGGAASPSPLSAPSGGGGGARPGHASGEGSGLIDIRALASATGVAGGPAASGASPSKQDNVDDLLSIGTGSPMTSGLGAPVLAPVQEEKGNKGLIITIAAVGGIVALAAAAVIVVMVTSEPEPAVAVNQAGSGVIEPGPGTTAAAGAAGGAVAEQPGATTAAADPTPSEQDTEEGGDEGTSDEAEGDEGSSGSSGRSGRRSGRSGRSSSSSSSSAMEAAPVAAPTMSSGGNSDIDDLLNQALGGMSSPMAAPMAAASDSNLPATPPRDGVLSALRSVQGAVSQCGNGQHGVANTTITVSGSNGRVSSARVSGQFQGTPVGSCVARAVRGARFPRFSRPTFQVSFPYRI